MAKAYIVTADENVQWSDQNTSILSVWSTRKLADRYIELHKELCRGNDPHNSPDDEDEYLYSVEEYEVQESL